MQRVGLSLSLCIRDIVIACRVPKHEVRFLYTGTCIRDPEGLSRVISEYRTSYWYHEPDRCEALARYYWEEGLVLQPRLEGALPPGALPFPDFPWTTLVEFNRVLRENSRAS